MHRFSYILSVPLAVVMVLFAIDNRDRLVVSWPLPWAGGMPSLLALLIGFFGGAAAIWLFGGKARRHALGLADTARAQGYQVAEYERRQTDVGWHRERAPSLLRVLCRRASAQVRVRPWRG